MRFIPLATACAVSFLALSSATAATIMNVSTGQNPSGTIQSADGSSDAFWIYNDPFINANVPPGTPTTGHPQIVIPYDNDFFPGWMANDSSSDWIAPVANVTNNGNAPYTFSITFNVTTAQLPTAALTGSWAIDDAGTLSLNGNQIASLSSGAWTSLTPFTAPSADFVVGTNTLTMTLTSSDNFKEGARLTGSVTSAVAATPEPSSLLLFGFGGLLAGVAGLKRARA